MLEVHNKKQIKKESPDFMWVVRDYYFKSKKTAKENLFMFLEEEENQDEKKRDEITKRNSIRETIKDCFQSHNCFYLPQPVESKRLIELDKINDYDEDYLNKFNNLKAELNRTISPNMVNNKYLIGKELSEYFKKIVQTINDEKVFYTYDAFNKIEANEAKKTQKSHEDIEQKIKEFNEKIASNLWESKVEPNIKPNNIEFYDVDELDRDLNEIKNELKAKSFELEGDTFETFWQNFLENKNYNSCKEKIQTYKTKKIRISTDPYYNTNGRSLYSGPRGGLYYYTTGEKKYLDM